MRSFLGSVLIVIGCASSQVITPAALVVTISQQSRVAPYQIGIPGGLPVDYQLEITNQLDDPVTLTSVEIETVGFSGAYTMKRVRHGFSLTVKPHATEVVPIRAWVQTLQQTDSGDVNAPVTLRGVARFDAQGGAVFKSPFVARVQ